VGTDGLAGGATATPGGDGGGVDAALVDGAQPPDASSDGGDAGAVRGCGLYPDATFCEDFDEPSTALSMSTWTDTSVGDPQGTITLVEAGAASPPSAARIALVSAATNCEYMKLSRSFVGALSRFETRFVVRPDTLGNFFVAVAAPSTTPGATYRVILSFEKPGTSTGYMSAFVQKHQGGTFSDFSVDTLPFTTDPLGKSFEVGVELTAAPNPKIIVREGTRALPLTTPADLAITNPRVDLGPYCQGEMTAFTFDDVAIWATP
jgi:hypothetical protein